MTVTLRSGHGRRPRVSDSRHGHAGDPGRRHQGRERKDRDRRHRRRRFSAAILGGAKGAVARHGHRRRRHHRGDSGQPGRVAVRASVLHVRLDSPVTMPAASSSFDVVSRAAMVGRVCSRILDRRVPVVPPPTSRAGCSGTSTMRRGSISRETPSARRDTQMWPSARCSASCTSNDCPRIATVRRRWSSVISSSAPKSVVPPAVPLLQQLRPRDAVLLELLVAVAPRLLAVGRQEVAEPRPQIAADVPDERGDASCRRCGAPNRQLAVRELLDCRVAERLVAAELGGDRGDRR